MDDIIRRQSKTYIQNTIAEWLFYLGGSIVLVYFVRWCSLEFGAEPYDFKVWLGATLYCWYISTMSLLLGSVYFIARYARTQLERRQSHPQKPESIDLTGDLTRLKKIETRSATITVILHLCSAAFVYFIARHIPGITEEQKIYAVLGTLAVAAIKPVWFSLQTIRAEIFGMLIEADYPAKTVAELWNVVHDFKDYEKRLEKTFERIDKEGEKLIQKIEEDVDKLGEKLEKHKEQLVETFDQKIEEYADSDKRREKAYGELKKAQTPLKKEMAKVTSGLQDLQGFVIELRDNNIEGERIMSALKVLGIDRLEDLKVSFEKNVVANNPGL